MVIVILLVGSILHQGRRYDGYAKPPFNFEETVLSSTDTTTEADTNGDSNENKITDVDTSSTTASSTTNNNTTPLSLGFEPGDVIGCFILIDSYHAVNNEIRFYKNGVDLGTAFCNAKNVVDAFPNETVTSSSSTSNSNAHLVPHAVYYPAISLYKRVSDLCSSY